VSGRKKNSRSAKRAAKREANRARRLSAFEESQRNSLEPGSRPERRSARAALGAVALAASPLLARPEVVALVRAGLAVTGVGGL
jgi:hypothetical protein